MLREQLGSDRQAKIDSVAVEADFYSHNARAYWSQNYATGAKTVLFRSIIEMLDGRGRAGRPLLSRYYSDYPSCHGLADHSAAGKPLSDQRFGG